ncbi:hypothetical protein TRFO_28042 [Tritrichomonas foetus]|uniref:Right handed beta helix domain-containing protein n=1 Tax=Tritrichomonas foetus TaxID=1144522 RepID=A0A1J4JZ82_9EUKA|nr:hypothetical protein TRFO_28042 [Tritrichomonas foetus]|eukprot:OHT04479.1 hypothetical protein TRFO_28042 [Tritrichomonas foetus]
MNLTLLSLAMMTMTSKSPFIQQSLSFYSKMISFQNSISNNFLSPFYIGNSVSNKQFYNCVFQQYLSSAIRIHSTTGNLYSQIHNKEVVGSKIFLTENATEIINCVFKNIQNYDTSDRRDNFGKNGAAIFSDQDLIIFGSTFTNIRCDCATVYLSEDASIKNLSRSSFEKCIGKTTASIFQEESRSSSIDIIDCLFTRQAASLFSCFYSTSKGQLYIDRSNFSDDFAFECVGCLEASNGPFILEYSRFTNVSARVHNGCIVLREISQMYIFSTLFVNCSHGSDREETGAIFLIYSSPLGTKFTNCGFIHTNMADSYSITIVRGQETFFTDCCFTEDKKKEISPTSQMIMFENTVFNSVCTDEVESMYKKGPKNNLITHPKIISEVPHQNSQKQCTKSLKNTRLKTNIKIGAIIYFSMLAIGFILTVIVDEIVTKFGLFGKNKKMKILL